MKNRAVCAPSPNNRPFCGATPNGEGGTTATAAGGILAPKPPLPIPADADRIRDVGLHDLHPVVHCSEAFD